MKKTDSWIFPVWIAMIGLFLIILFALRYDWILRDVYVVGADTGYRAEIIYPDWMSTSQGAPGFVTDIQSAPIFQHIEMYYNNSPCQGRFDVVYAENDLWKQMRYLEGLLVIARWSAVGIFGLTMLHALTKWIGILRKTWKEAVLALLLNLGGCLSFWLIAVFLLGPVSGFGPFWRDPVCPTNVIAVVDAELVKITPVGTTFLVFGVLSSLCALVSLILEIRKVHQSET